MGLKKKSKCFPSWAEVNRPDLTITGKPRYINNPNKRADYGNQEDGTGGIDLSDVAHKEGVTGIYEMTDPISKKTHTVTTITSSGEGASGAGTTIYKSGQPIAFARPKGSGGSDKEHKYSQALGGATPLKGSYDYIDKKTGEKLKSTEDKLAAIHAANLKKGTPILSKADRIELKKTLSKPR